MNLLVTCNYSDGREWFPKVSLIEKDEYHWLVFHSDVLNISNLKLEENVSGSVSCKKIVNKFFNEVILDAMKAYNISLYPNSNSLSGFVEGYFMGKGVPKFSLLNGSQK